MKSQLILNVFYSVDETTDSNDQPIFLVCHDQLVQLFKRFCFYCKASDPKGSGEKIGSMVNVVQSCDNCIEHNFTWRTQRMVLERYPARNIMTSYGILMSGINISQVMLIFRHMNLSTISVRPYHLH